MADKEAVANVQRYFKELNANLGNFKAEQTAGYQKRQRRLTRFNSKFEE